MATRTYVHCIFPGLRVEFDVNDANWRMSQVRAINASPFIGHASIYDGSTLKFEVDAPANQTSSWNTTGIQLSWNSVDQNLDLGTYIIRVTFPL